MDNTPFLSMIIPIYNRENYVSKLYQNLLPFDLEDIEIIIIDDASKDNTLKRLRSELKFKKAKLRILSNSRNKGPGGARNTGLENCKGKFLWIIDSDDKFHIEALEFLRINQNKDFDFIAYNMKYSNDPTIIRTEMGLKKGEYGYHETLPDKCRIDFGYICTKIFKSSFLFNMGIYYPENCFFEDNFPSFVLRFYSKRFIKSDVIAFTYTIDNESITRTSTFDNRYYDRYITAFLGLIKTSKFIKNQHEADLLYKIFYKTFYKFPLAKYYTNLVNGTDKIDNFKRLIQLESLFTNIYPEIEKALSPYKIEYKKPDYKSRSLKYKILMKLITPFTSKKYNLNYYLELNKQNWDQEIYFKEDDEKYKALIKTLS